MRTIAALLLLCNAVATSVGAYVLWEQQATIRLLFLLLRQAQQ